jgi:hypothetical protein
VKKYTVTLFLFVFMTSSSLALLATEALREAEPQKPAREILADPNSKKASDSTTLHTSTPDSSTRTTSHSPTPITPRLQLDDSMFSDDEYTLISSVPATQKPAWKRHYEYVGARILSAFLAIHKYATESYGSFKKFIIYKIMRRKPEPKMAENKQPNLALNQK